MFREHARGGVCAAVLLSLAGFVGILLAADSISALQTPWTADSSAALLTPPATVDAGTATKPERFAAKLHPFLLRQFDSQAGAVKTWVFFVDKGFRTAAERDAAIQRLAATYDPRAIQRRMLRGEHAGQADRLFDERDLPVAAAYIDAVIATGARLHVTSRWLDAVSVYATRAQAEQIAKLPYVDRLEAVARARRIEPLAVKPVQDGPSGGRGGDRSLDYGLSTDQLNQINLIALHNSGDTAGGVIVGILDTGFHRTHEVFHYPGHPLNVIAEWDFVMNDPNTDIEPGDPPDQHTHGTMILGCLAAYKPGTLVGGAFDAAFVLCKTEDITQEVPAEEDNYVAGLEFIEAHGGDMTTSSLGYIDWYTQAQLDGQTAVTTIGVNTATSLGLYCCTAAGNSGHDADPATSHLLAPADAFKVLACGAADSGGNIAGFSSDGPTADGRVKPELLARGVDTFTISPWSDTDYTTASGTSLSTPLVASAVACLAQAHPTWTVDQMRTYLTESAGDYVANGAYDPLYIRGYGMVNAYAASQDCNGNGVPDIRDIRAGTSRDDNHNGIPDECERRPGDLNCDGVINFGDIDPFVTALTNRAAYEAQYPACLWLNGDCNSDGTVDFADIDPFVALLGG